MNLSATLGLRFNLGKKTKYVPVPIRRCDSFRIKITGAGDFQLYAMQIEVRTEETNRKGG